MNVTIFARKTTIVVAVLAFAASAQPASAGLLTMMMAGGAFAACKSNPKCAAKMSALKDRAMNACANSAKCSNFAAGAAGGQGYVRAQAGGYGGQSGYGGYPAYGSGGGSQPNVYGRQGSGGRASNDPGYGGQGAYGGRQNDGLPRLNQDY